MIRVIPDFPRTGLEFRHTLGVSQRPDRLSLCTSLLCTHFAGDWAKIDDIVSCEAGGFVYATALTLDINKSLLLIREAGKLPRPTFSVVKPCLNVSPLASKVAQNKRIEMERDVLPGERRVVVVDDVLATGPTLCAVLQLAEAGIGADRVSIMVGAEFPAHRGRELLRQNVEQGQSSESNGFPRSLGSNSRTAFKCADDRCGGTMALSMAQS
jgi:adenine phosphoribosyltransferase